MGQIIKDASVVEMTEGQLTLPASTEVDSAD
jgi:hypothetical protein